VSEILKTGMDICLGLAGVCAYCGFVILIWEDASLSRVTRIGFTAISPIAFLLLCVLLPILIMVGIIGALMRAAWHFVRTPPHSNAEGKGQG